jgi:hypothetical protein
MNPHATPALQLAQTQTLLVLLAALLLLLLQPGSLSLSLSSSLLPPASSLLNRRCLRRFFGVLRVVACPFFRTPLSVAEA